MSGWKRGLSDGKGGCMGCLDEGSRRSLDFAYNDNPSTLIHEAVPRAIEREKQIKSWKRRRKDDLIDNVNPERIDLMP